MTFEEASKLPDTNWENPLPVMKVLMTDIILGNYYWVWVKNKDGKYDIDLSSREVKH